MANTPGFFENMGNSIFGGGDSALTSLQKNGYAQYNPTAAPGTSQFFQGYQAQNANTGANAPYEAARQGLMGNLASQAAGTGGPTVADQQLRAGLGATLSAQRAAAAGARGQSAGLAQHALASQAAGAESNYAGQAGAQRAQEQQNAQGQLGGLTQGAIGQGNQLAETNQSAQNSAAAERAAMGEAYGSMQNQNWQYYNNMMNQNQAQQNAAVAGQTNQAVAENQAIMGNPLNQAGSLASAGAQLTGAGAAVPGVAEGGVFGMDEGGVAPISASAENGNFNIPTLPSVSISAPQYVQPINKGDKGPGGNTSGGGSQSSGSSPGPDMTGSGGALGGAGGGGAMGGDAMAALADGGVKAPVTSGPQEAVIGENGPEAVVPIKPNGDVDQARARNPALRQLLASHPDLRHVQPNGRAPGAPTGTGDHATAAALAMAGAHLSDRVAQLESIIPQLAKRGARRAA